MGKIHVTNGRKRTDIDRQNELLMISNKSRQQPSRKVGMNKQFIEI